MWEVTFSRSTDYGATWLPEIYLSTIDSIESYKPHIATDTAGNVYVVWYDGKYGTSTGFAGTVLLRRSTDYGQTWLPEQIISEKSTGMVPRVSVSGNIVGVVWCYEIFGDPGYINRTYCRISTDRGGTWSPEYDLSPLTNYNVDQDIVVSDQYVHVTWSDTVAFQQSEIFYRCGKLLTTNIIDPISQLLPSEFELEQNFPNPFNNGTRFSFSVPKQSVISLDILNSLGQRVTTITNGLYESGRYSVSWNAKDISSGVYIVVLKTEQKSFYRKILLLK
jgi:hypothetical protein